MHMRKLMSPFVPGFKTFIRPLHLPRCHLTVNTFRCFCSEIPSDDRNGKMKTFKEKLFSKHFLPDDQEAQLLQNKFPDPKKVVDDLFAPFLKVDEQFAPKIHVKRKFDNNIVTTKLEICWPVLTEFCGIHKDEETSLHNAYLQACDLLLHLGLVELSKTGIEVYTVDRVIKMLEELASKQSYIGKDTDNFRILNLLQSGKGDRLKWTSTIQVLWPVSFTITSSSPCLDLAYYQSSLGSLMKLKTLGLLDGHNNLKKAVLLGLVKYDSHMHYLKQRDLSNPDYEIYVDASKVGMGAYLLSKDNAKIRWLSDSWRQDMVKFSPESDVQLAEFYALVTAIYTWKHKFIGKKVLCYSDNICVVNIINHGYYSPKISRSPKSFYNLFILLVEVCYRNDITIVADHVARMNNVPADLLSRCNVDAFKKMIPTAFETPKKSKKLWFCNFTEDKSNISDDKMPKS